MDVQAMEYLRRSLVNARARASQRGRQHWTSAFSHLEAWIISKPAPSATSSGPASEFSSVVSGADFSVRLLVSTSSPLAQQDLVVQVQNGVNMASGTATRAPSTATTAPSTAPTAPAMPLTAGPSTIELIVPIVVPLGAQGTPSVIQRARPVVRTEQQTMHSTEVYGPLPYCHIRQPCRTLPCLLCQQGLITQWVIMVRAISSLLRQIPIGCLRESRCYNISSFRNGSSLKLGDLAKPSLSLSPPLFLNGASI